MEIEKIFFRRLRREDRLFADRNLIVPSAQGPQRRRLRRKGTDWDGNFKKKSLGVFGVKVGRLPSEIVAGFFSPFGAKALTAQARAAQGYRLGWKFQKTLLARLRREDASLSILKAEIIAGFFGPFGARAPAQASAAQGYRLVEISTNLRAFGVKVGCLQVEN